MCYFNIDVVHAASIPAFLSLLGKRAFIMHSSWDRSRYIVVPEIYLPPVKSQTHLQYKLDANITLAVGNGYMKRASTQFYAPPLTVVVATHLCHAYCVLSPELDTVDDFCRSRPHLLSDGAA